MRAPRSVAALRNLRTQSLWRLLAADKAPLVVAMLHEIFLEGQNSLQASALIERLTNTLEALRADAEDLPQTAQAYIADWLGEGWLVRRLPPGASEEQYELSSDALQAIRFVISLLRRRALATESRLSLVMQQLVRLAEETDPNPETRVATLVVERDRIDREIESVRTRGVTPLSDERALERAREIIALTDELAADFRRVRDDFDQLNRNLRQSLIENEGSRGDVLEALFAGVDLIGQSDAGKTFSAFWRLLTNPEQSEALREALDVLSRRPFLTKLQTRDRRFLLNVTSLLTGEGGNVHDVLQSLARSLKTFVQGREFLEQRRLNSLLQRALQAALAARGHVRPTEMLDYVLALTSSRIRSVSQISLYDPAERMSDTAMRNAEAAEIELSVISELVRQSEIDFRTLRRHLRDLLETRARVTIAQVLERFPAEQGFGSVVGYVALGARHGEVTRGNELVEWRGQDDEQRRARVPMIHFVRERHHELVD